MAASLCVAPPATVAWVDRLAAPRHAAAPLAAGAAARSRACAGAASSSACRAASAMLAAAAATSTPTSRQPTPCTAPREYLFCLLAISPAHVAGAVHTVLQPPPTHPHSHPHSHPNDCRPDSFAAAMSTPASARQAPATIAGACRPAASSSHMPHTTRRLGHPGVRLLRAACRAGAMAGNARWPSAEIHTQLQPPAFCWPCPVPA